MPAVDVLIHTGDLTNFGDLDALRARIKMLDFIPAEIRLVIFGNHDTYLDRVFRVDNMSDDEYARMHVKAWGIMFGRSAQEKNIRYLEEGTHTFSLKNDADFTVYASPYTPGSGGLAFP